MLQFIFVTSLFLLSASQTTEQMNSSDNNITDSEMSYLIRYEYLKEVDDNQNGNPININNGTLVNIAISNMQKFFNITVTGQMDENTRTIMKKARCGVSDVKISLNSEYNIGSRWDKKHITWKVRRYTTQVSRAVLLDVIAYSLNVWAEVSGLTFEYAPLSPVDIEIGFYKGVHLGEPTYSSFDGRNGVLAHAYFPMPGYTLGGDTHMDDDELWAVKRKPTEYSKVSLAVVFVHEFGHALGLDHEPAVRDSVMRPIYSGWAEKVILSRDDIAGIQAIYGKPTDKYTTTIKSTTQTSSETTTIKSPSTTTKTVDVDIFCRIEGIDSAVEHNTISYLLFKGNNVRRVYINGKIRKFRIQRLFIGSLKDVKIDVAIRTYTYRMKINGTWQTGIRNNMYLFQGSKVHTFIYSNKRYREKNVAYISSKFPGLPNNLDAAFRWSGNNKMHFIKDNKVYRIKETSNGFVVHKNYPKDMSMWKGLPANIDAALNMKKYNNTLFFKGNDYYKFSDKSLEVESGYPRNVQEDWFGCLSSDLTRSSEELPIFRNLNNTENVPEDIIL